MVRILIVVTILSFVYVIPSAGQGTFRSQRLYTNWGIGYAEPYNYDAGLEEYRDVYSAYEGVRNLTLSFDWFGMYWPKGNQVLIGGIFNGYVDRYSGGDAPSDFQVLAYTVAFSTLYFFHDRIGKGIFGRVDIGPSKMYLSQGGSYEPWGIGYGIDWGVGVPLNLDQSVLIFISFDGRLLGGDSYSNLGVAMSFLH